MRGLICSRRKTHCIHFYSTAECLNNNAIYIPDTLKPLKNCFFLTWGKWQNTTHFHTHYEFCETVLSADQVTIFPNEVVDVGIFLAVLINLSLANSFSQNDYPLKMTECHLKGTIPNGNFI